MIASTPQPPYYAVIFTSVKTTETGGYDAMAEKMYLMAKEQPGYLGAESARNEVGITVSYWRSLEDIRNWKQQADHLIAQHLGKTKWYEQYKTRIALVERDYGL